MLHSPLPVLRVSYFETFLGVHPKSVHRAGAPKLLLSADLGEFLLFLFLQKYRTATALQPLTAAATKDSTPPLLSYLAFVTSHLHTLLLLIRDPHKHVHDIALPLSPHSAHSPRTPSSPPSTHPHPSTTYYSAPPSTSSSSPSSPSPSLSPSPSSSPSTSSSSPSSQCLDPHEFNRLSFLLFAHNSTIEREEQRERVRDSVDMLEPDERKEVVDLSSLTPFFKAGATAIPLAVVEEWLLRHLSSAVNPSLVSSPTLHHGHLVYPPLVRHTLVAGQSGSPVRLAASDVQGGDLTLRQLLNCSVRVQTHSRYALIEDVSASSVQAGVVSGLLVVRGCSHLTLTVACRALHLADCRAVTVYLFSSTRPVVLGGGSEAIVLAPYNTYYPSLAADLAVASLPTSVNCWSSPILMSSASGTTSSSLLHSPLRGSRTLGSGAPSSSPSFTYHHQHLSTAGLVHGHAPPSPPPPSSPRRSTSPSPLLASLSPPARDPRDPQSSPTSPFRRSATNPLSPSSLSPSSTSSSFTSTVSSTTSSLPDRRTPRDERRDSGDRGRGRDRVRMSLTTAVVKEVQETRSSSGSSQRRVHRMSDHGEGGADDSGSEYSTDDERGGGGAGVGGGGGDRLSTPGMSRPHARSASYSAGEKKDGGSAMAALKAHHQHNHSHGSDDHSPLHLSPASLSPPFGPLLQPPHIVGLSPLTTTGHSSLPSAAASLSAFFPLSPHSASSSLAQAVTLLPPEQFFSLPPPPSSPLPAPSPSNPNPTPSPTTANPFPLPSLYADSLTDRSSRAIHARSLIDAANLSAAEAAVLQAKLEEGFEQWMRATFAQVVVEELVGTGGGKAGAGVQEVVKEVVKAGE